MYALQSFIHKDWNFYAGEQVDADHPMVALRPDLFTVDPPKKSTKKEAS